MTCLCMYLQPAYLLFPGASGWLYLLLWEWLGQLQLIIGTCIECDRLSPEYCGMMMVPVITYHLPWLMQIMIFVTLRDLSRDWAIWNGKTPSCQTAQVLVPSAAILRAHIALRLDFIAGEECA